MMESQTLAVFTERVSRSAGLKLKLVWLTFAVLGIPLAAGISTGLPGRMGLLLALVLAAPILYLVFGALEWAKGVRISPGGVFAIFADSALGYSGLAAFWLLLLLLGVRSESSTTVIRELPGWLQKLVQ